MSASPVFDSRASGTYIPAVKASAANRCPAATLRVASVAALVGLLVAACGGDDWRTQPIQSYGFFDGQLVVEGHCNDDGRALVVEESAETVRVRLEVSGPSQGDCLACPAVPITEDLGDRILIDDPTGREILLSEAC